MVSQSCLDLKITKYGRWWGWGEGGSKDIGYGKGKKRNVLIKRLPPRIDKFL